LISHVRNSRKGLIFSLTIKYCFISLIATLLSGCPFDVYRVELTPVTLQSPATSLSGFILQEQVNLNIGYGYERTLKVGTNWIPVGTIPYGDVFKSEDQVLTVEASNIYEAYIVVSNDEVVGFYLPVEDSYSPLVYKQALNIKNNITSH
jgi:hypothetical protein